MPCDDLIGWAMWYEKSDDERIVARTEIPGGVVSTVFLGLDHNFMGNGPPLLFETMIFRDGEGDETWRCSTWLEAEAQHQKVVLECLEKTKGVKAWRT